MDYQEMWEELLEKLHDWVNEAYDLDYVLDLDSENRGRFEAYRHVFELMISMEDGVE